MSPLHSLHALLAWAAGDALGSFKLTRFTPIHLPFFYLSGEIPAALQHDHGEEASGRVGYALYSYQIRHTDLKKLRTEHLTAVECQNAMAAAMAKAFGNTGFKTLQLHDFLIFHGDPP